MKMPQPLRRPRGFTLVELLVTITIIAVLAILSFLFMRSAREKAWAAASTSNLRQCASAVHSYVSDNGRFPEGWDFEGGGSWSWQVREYLGYGTDSQWPTSIILHPRHGKLASSTTSRPHLHHYAASAIVMQDVDETVANPKKYIRMANITEPGRVILLGDGPLKTKGNAASGSHAAWWNLRFGNVTGNPNDTVGTAGLANIEFWLKGKAHFVFVDGHVEVLLPKDVKRRFFQLDPTL